MRQSAEGVSRRPFGKTADGKAVDLYTLTNAKGMQATITNYGGIVVSLVVPDREGKLGDVVLGFDTLDEYLAGHPYFGALVGPLRQPHRPGQVHARRPAIHAGAEQQRPTPARRRERIRQGRVGGQGRRAGQDRRRYEAAPGLVLSYTSKDGEEGYPGNSQGYGALCADATTTHCRSVTKPPPTRPRRST